MSTTTQHASNTTPEQEALFPCVTPLYDEPLVLQRGKGCRVIDNTGRSYLDLFSGILTTSLGHCHPEVVERVREQIGHLGHTSTLYITENQEKMASRLAAITPGDLSRTFFTNSGTEAVETAIQLACCHTGRSEIITVRHAYSGRSILASNLTGHAPWRPLPTSIPGIKHCLVPNPYRCPFGTPCDERCLDAFEQDLLETIETTTTGRPAAFMMETILGIGGYIVPPPGYFQRISRVLREHGALLIIDEVQTGFGRTGEKWFGIEHWEVEPDIMVMAKGIANGFPVGATIAKPEIAGSWKSKTISTFGGNPVCMAAALATNDVMVREGVPRLAARRGEQLRQGLKEIQERHSWIGDVRGMGLMQALELVDDRAGKSPSPARAKALLEATKAEGLLVGIGGLKANVIRIGPSLLIGEAEISEGLDRLERACRRVVG